VIKCRHTRTHKQILLNVTQFDAGVYQCLVDGAVRAQYDVKVDEGETPI
jgi:hypothetical protein